MCFQLKYAILLVISLVFGSVYVTGPIAVSYIIMCITAVMCFFEKVSFPRHKVIMLYTIFIAVYSLTCLLYGYLTLWASSMIGFYFISYIWIWATYILIEKYHSIKTLLYTLLFIGFVNAVVTIGQHFMHPLALAVPVFLQKKGFEHIDYLADRVANDDYGFALWGVFDMVSNGYFSCVTTLLSVYLFSRVPKIFSIPFWMLSIVALFYTQERAAFVFGAFFSILYMAAIFTNSRQSWKKVLVVTIVSFVVAYIYEKVDIQSIIEGSRYVSFEMGTRTQIYDKSYEYFASHPFTANLYDFYFTTKLYPHNIVYNAFICGTFVGGALILIAWASLIIKGLVIIKSSFEKKVNKELIAISFAFMGYNAICITHNASIVSGDLLFWLLATPVIFTSASQK